jgi:hypothetical protein
MNFRLCILPACLLIFFSVTSALRALDDDQPFTLNLPCGANEVTPTWLGQPVIPATTFATLDLPVAPPDPNASLLVTVFFQEKNGGFLRISWQSGAAPVPAPTDALPGPGEAALSSVLSDNFYEGIGMANQRSLLVPAAAMKQPGQLVFQCGDTTLGISRIKLEWLQNSTGLSSPAITDTLVTPANGKTQTASELAGQPPLAQDGAWHDRIVDVPVTAMPLRIEQGVDFTVQMDGAPTRARLTVKENGLPWGQHLVIWINNQRVGVVAPAVPELGDAGYPEDKDAPYVGWREATFHVPAGSLTAGNDTLQFSAEPDVPPVAPPDPNAAPVPLALKDVKLQLDYPANSTASASVVPAASVPGQTPAAPAPVSAATPSGRIVTPASPDVAATPAPNAQNPALLSLPASEPSSSSP